MVNRTAIKSGLLNQTATHNLVMRNRVTDTQTVEGAPGTIVPGRPGEGGGAPRTIVPGAPSTG